MSGRGFSVIIFGDHFEVRVLKCFLFIDHGISVSLSHEPIHHVLFEGLYRIDFEGFSFC
jgi:hypothetical protein